MKLFCVVAYKGTAYSGFQRQNRHRSVQGEIEKALSTLLSVPTKIRAAGRTDAGVHAKGQTFCFESGPIKDASAFLRSLNSLLPEDIYVRSLCDVADEFDARLSAKGKVYEYRFLIDEPDPLRVGYVAQLRRNDFKFEPFLQALRCFEGTHNFQNFTTKPTDDDGFVRSMKVLDAHLEEEGNLAVIRLYGDGFMRYQIRLIIGACIRVGIGKMDLDFIRQALVSSKREIVSFKAPAEGLTLLEVDYENVPVL